MLANMQESKGDIPQNVFVIVSDDLSQCDSGSGWGSLAGENDSWAQRTSRLSFTVESTYRDLEDVRTHTSHPQSKTNLDGNGTPTEWEVVVDSSSKSKVNTILTGFEDQKWNQKTGFKGAKNSANDEIVMIECSKLSGNDSFLSGATTELSDLQESLLEKDEEANKVCTKLKRRHATPRRRKRPRNLRTKLEGLHHQIRKPFHKASKFMISSADFFKDQILGSSGPNSSILHYYFSTHSSILSNAKKGLLLSDDDDDDVSSDFVDMPWSIPNTITLKSSNTEERRFLDQYLHHGDSNPSSIENMREKIDSNNILWLYARPLQPI